MANNLQAFQIFAKPVGARCNLHCQYCYYLDKNILHQGSKGALMDDETLEQYIIQHIVAADSVHDLLARIFSMDNHFSYIVQTDHAFIKYAFNAV